MTTNHQRTVVEGAPKMLCTLNLCVSMDDGKYVMIW